MNPMFYFLLALTAVLAATANAAGPVLDVNGDLIFGGSSYYVLPAIWGPGGGGLTLSSLGDKQCPLYIQKEDSEVERGLPVKFSNWRLKVPFVPESENLNIEMDVAATICVQSTYWWVAPSNLPIMTFWIAAGPKPDHGEDSSRSFFQIKRTGEFHNGYKITFCSGDGACDDVGIARDGNGVGRLAVGSEPFAFVFVKASEAETSPKTMSII
ncbi:kunitz trypsin inhibitor 1 [Raphanus sativus]|uniref:Kunitz trypsin inhibitor 4-like n=1 Tax=Raphanus sativus TaxID=3726 RepID=A0A6J0L5F7_RAPSA|nr:kunitz trypsin inhibitor 4-like [Raphanus sativus]KAJ4875014.1 kunitz trypsin inhibitor 1 [Raphanus sativus]